MINLSEPTKALFRKEWYYHHSKFWKMPIALVLFSCFTILSLKVLPILIQGMGFSIPEFTVSNAVYSYFNNINSMFAIIGIILCVDIIAGEREKKTLLLLKTTVIKERSIILTKFFIRYSLMVLSSIIASLVAYVLITLLFSYFSAKLFLLSLLLHLLTLACCMSIGVITSVISKTQLIAGVLGVACYFVLNLVSAMLSLANLNEYNILNLSSILATSSISSRALCADITIIVVIAFFSLTLSIYYFKHRSKEE